VPEWGACPNGGLLTYFLPVRIQVKCTNSQLPHSSSTGGRNQLDPFHYLHLPDHGADIRGSQIALYFRHNVQDGSTTAVVINMTDGRWPQTVEEPQRRIKESLKHPEGVNLTQDPFFVHLIYFTSLMRWWTNALSSLNKQLITYVCGQCNVSHLAHINQ